MIDTVALCDDENPCRTDIKAPSAMAPPLHPTHRNLEKETSTRETESLDNEPGTESLDNFTFGPCDGAQKSEITLSIGIGYPIFLKLW